MILFLRNALNGDDLKIKGEEENWNALALKPMVNIN